MKKSLPAFLVLTLFLSACGSAPSPTPMPVQSTATEAASSTPTQPKSTPEPTASATPTQMATEVIQTPSALLSVDNFMHLGVIQVFLDAIDAAVKAEFGTQPGGYSMDFFTISPDGMYVAVGGCTNLSDANCYGGSDPGHTFLNIFEVASGQITSRVPVEGTDVRGLAFTPDSSRLVYALCPHQGAVWDIRQQKVERVFWQEGGCKTYPRVTVSRDGNQVALVSGSTMMIYNLSNGERIAELPSSGYSRIMPKYSASGNRLIVFTQEDGKDIAVYDTTTWTLVNQIHITDGATAARAVDISPDGDMIATAEIGNDLGIQLWDVSSGQKLADLDDPLQWIETLAFSPDGSLLLVSGSSEDLDSLAAMSAWDVKNQQWLGSVNGMYYPLWITFSRDGRVFLGADELFGPMIWGLPDQNFQAARQAAEGFVGALIAGDYATATTWFQPDAEMQGLLQGAGYDITDMEATLEAICAQDHQPCMPIQEILYGTKETSTSYQFVVTFTAPNGSIYQDAYGQTIQSIFVDIQPDGNMRVYYLPNFFLSP